MSANITNMPVVPEYLRTTLSFDDEGITNFVVHGMRPLRVKQEPLKDLLCEAKEKALKMHNEGYDPDFIAQHINHQINETVTAMVADGVAFVGEQLRGADVTGYIKELQLFSYVYSNDGYSFFNPSQFPASMSMTKH